MTFSTNDIPSQEGKVAIVTGANTGIGKVTALELAKKGAHVIMACRSAERTEPVVEELKKETGNDKIEFLELDLSSLTSIRAFGEKFKERGLPLHLLINNAGVMMSPFGLTQDGLETQFGTNHVGHFYLTMLLLPFLEKSQPSRVVVLSSLAHNYPYTEGILFDHINSPQHFSTSKAYGQSKLANLLFGNELARRIGDRGIFVNSVHPGYVATELQRHVNNWGRIAAFFANLGYALLALSPEKGALTQLYAATHPDIEEKGIKGRYFVPIAKEATPSAQGRDQDLAKKLWDFTEDILKQKLGDLYVPVFPSSD